MKSQRIKELFDYDPVRGRLIRKISRGNQFSGEIAGSESKQGGHRSIRVDYKHITERRAIWMWHYGDDNVPTLIGTYTRIPDDNRIENLYAKNRNHEKS
jgi:hypothetical protein